MSYRLATSICALIVFSACVSTEDPHDNTAGGKADDGQSTVDPFDPSSCTDSTPMPFAEAAQWLGSDTSATVAPYKITIRKRVCNQVTGNCGSWKAQPESPAGDGDLQLGTSTADGITVQLVDGKALPGCGGPVTACGKLAAPLLCKPYLLMDNSGRVGVCPALLAGLGAGRLPIKFGGVVGSHCTRLRAAAEGSVYYDGSYEQYESVLLTTHY